MVTHLHRLQKAVIGYDTDRGVATLSIRDGKLFPNGFFYEFPQNAYPTSHIRQQMIGNILTEEEWAEQSDKGYHETLKNHNTTSMSEEKLIQLLETKWHPSLYLGTTSDGLLVEHAAFARSSRSSTDQSEIKSYPKPVLIHGPSGSGKSVLLEFLYRQYVAVNPRAAKLVYFNLQDLSAETISPAVRPNGKRTVRAVDAVAELYATPSPVVVFVDGLDTATGHGRVITGALESLIRSQENANNLSFFVTKREIGDTEYRYYNQIITADKAPIGHDACRGVYSMSSPVAPNSPTILFHAPSAPILFGEKSSG